MILEKQQINPHPWTDTGNRRYTLLTDENSNILTDENGYLLYIESDIIADPWDNDSAQPKKTVFQKQSVSSAKTSWS